MTGSGRRGPSLGRKVAFALVPVGVLLGGTEAALRILDVDVGLERPPGYGLGPGNDETRCHTSSVTRGWAWAAGACGRDELGLLTLPEGAEDGQPEILVVGDSIATHTGWIARMTLDLRARYPGIVARTGGASGYDTCQELRLVVEVVDAVGPDLVLLQTCPNDLVGTPTLVTLPGGTVRYFLGEEAFDFPSAVLHSRLLTGVVLRLGAAHMARRTPVGDAESERHMGQCLDALRDELDEREVPLLVARFPVLADPGEGVEETMLRQEAVVGTLVDSAGVPHLDLRPVLANAGPWADWRYKSEDRIHPNRAAQEVVGRALADWVLGTGALVDDGGT